MPYVPSKKTVPPAPDRELIDIFVEKLADQISNDVTDNLSLLTEYKRVFMVIANKLAKINQENKFDPSGTVAEYGLAHTIHATGKKYEYEGAFLGELNYAITRLIQRVPQLLVQKGKWADELRYWVYAQTVSALIYASRHTENYAFGIDGCFEDTKDEYKRRVNPAYEAWQILKNGDCYDTPYYTRLVEVVDENGQLVGHQEIMLKRSEATLRKDVLDGQFVLRQKPQKPATSEQMPAPE